MSLVNLLFGFNGRINRMQYWLATIGSSFVAGMISYTVTFSMLMGASAMPKDGAAAANLGMLVAFVVICAISGWINTAIQWKRFHDRGRPGWIALAPLLPTAMMVMHVVSSAASNAPFGQMLSGLMTWLMVLMAMGLYFFIELGCLAGNAGPNKYGNPPGSGGGVHTPVPQAPAGAAPSTAASTLFGAQSAMDRAIAEHQTQRPAAPRPALAGASAAASAPGGAPSFGRRAPR